jgi:hypothetical protein
MTEPQKDALTWDEYFGRRYDWLTKQIGTLENVGITNPNQQLAISWTRNLYEEARDHLGLLNETRRMISDLRKTIDTLQKRLELLEAESSEQAKDRTIRGLDR